MPTPLYAAWSSPAVFECVLQYVSVSVKLCQLVRLCRSAPPLTARCFLFDHVRLTPLCLAALRRSASLRLLLSRLPSVHYRSTREDAHHTALLACLSDDTPHGSQPFLAQLRCCILDLSSEAHRTDGIDIRGAGQLNGACRLLAALSARCSLLSSLGLLSSNRRFSPPGHLLRCLQRLPHLTTLRLDGCDTGYRSTFDLSCELLTALLSLPALHYIDLAGCCVWTDGEHTGEEAEDAMATAASDDDADDGSVTADGSSSVEHNAHSPLPQTSLPQPGHRHALTVLLPPTGWEQLFHHSEQSAELIQSYSLQGQEGRGLTSLLLPPLDDEAVEDDDDGATARMAVRSFLHSQRGLTQLMLECDNQQLAFYLLPTSPAEHDDEREGDGMEDEEEEEEAAGGSGGAATPAAVSSLPSLSTLTYRATSLHEPEEANGGADCAQAILLHHVLPAYGRSLRCLELLELQEAMPLQAVVHACAAHCPSLTSLMLSVDRSATLRAAATSEEASAPAEANLRLSLLTVLDARTELGDEHSLLTALRACPALERLYLYQLEQSDSGAARIGVGVLPAIGELCPRLEQLHLDGFPADDIVPAPSAASSAQSTASSGPPSRAASSAACGFPNLARLSLADVSGRPDVLAEWLALSLRSAPLCHLYLSGPAAEELSAPHSLLLRRAFPALVDLPSSAPALARPSHGRRADGPNSWTAAEAWLRNEVASEHHRSRDVNHYDMN